MAPSLPRREFLATGFAPVFFAHPTWLRLRDDPRYQDNVSKVTSHFLLPTTYSQF